jgi:hypothetical protein
VKSWRHYILSKFGRDLQDMKASSEGGGSNAAQMVRYKHPYAKNSFQSTGLENIVILPLQLWVCRLCLQGRDSTKQCSFHLVPHFEECSPGVTVNC